MFRVPDLPESLRVFLSYTKDDEQTAGSLADDLRAAGLVPSRIDDVSPDDDWRGYLDRTVAEADSYIVLIGENPTQEDYTEWQAILRSNWADPHKQIVPVLVDDATLPPAFAEWQAIQLRRDATEDLGTKEQIESALPDLLDVLSHPRPPSAEAEPTIKRDFLERLNAIGDLNQLLRDDPDSWQ
jgi:hypothetical protein